MRSLSPQAVAVVGAGIVGRLTALRLARAGHAVTVYERRSADSDQAASFVAAGILAPTAEAVHGFAELRRWGRRSVALWQTLLPTLVRPVAMATRGSLVLTRAGDQTEVEHFATLLAHQTPEAPIVRLDPAAVAKLEPGLGESGLAGLCLEGEGQIDNRQAMTALATTLTATGVRCLFATPAEVEPYRVLLDGGVQTYDQVFDCRGLGAQADLPDLRGVRGEAVLLQAPEAELTRPVRILHPRYPIYVVPREPGRFLVGATEIESDDDGPVSLTSALELLGAAYALAPGFRFAKIERLLAGVRPAFSDHRPRIQMQPGLMRLNGLYRHGCLLGPLVADTAVRLFHGETLDADLRSLAPLSSTEVKS